jgi:hypothetical protein
MKPNLYALALISHINNMFKNKNKKKKQKEYFKKQSFLFLLIFSDM